MARAFRVLLTTSFQVDPEDVTGYVTPDWGSARLIAEPRLLQFEAGDLTFTVCDRDVDSTHTARYWSNRIMQSTTVPTITVQDYTDTDAPLPLFYGWIERNQTTWDGEVLTRFTAVTQLSYADRLDVAEDPLPASFVTVAAGTAGAVTLPSIWTVSAWATNAADYITAGVLPGDVLSIDGYVHQPTVKRVLSKNQVEVDHTFPATATPTGASRILREPITTYSGLAAPLARRLLQRIGNLAPLANATYPDVTIDDFEHGTGQTDTDWSHVLRTTADAGVDPTVDDMLSEFVPSVSGDRLGFICINGKLYRVDKGIPSGGSAKTGIVLTQITRQVPDPGSGSLEDISSAHRLFLFKDAAGFPYLVVAQQKTQVGFLISNTYTQPWENAGQMFANASGFTGAAMLKIGLSSPVVLTTMMCLNTIAQGIESYGQMQQTITPSGNVYRTIKQVSLVDIGDGTNDPSTGVGARISLDMFGSFDRHQYPMADAITVVYDANAALGSYAYIANYNESNNQSTLEVAYYNGGHVSHNPTPSAIIPGRAIGGIGGQAVADNVAILLAVATDKQMCFRIDGDATAGVDLELDAAASKYLYPVDLTTGGTKYVGFVPGNVDDYFRAWITSSGSHLWVHADKTGGVYGTLPSGFRPLIAGPETGETAGPGAVNGMPLIYRALDDNSEEQIYAGWLYVNAGQLTFQTTDKCVYPIPAARESELRPPFIFEDTTQNVWRFLIHAARIDGSRLVQDFYLSGLYSGVFVHYNFGQLRSRMSIRQALVSICQAGCCNLRLMGLARPTSAAGVKIASKHSYDPTDIGEANYTDHVIAHPRMIGTEYYLGVESSSYGQRVTVGTVDISSSRAVFNLSSPFIQPGLARAIGAWIVDRYPERSTDYPNGRRLFEFNVRALDDPLSVEFTPDYDDIYQLLTFEGFRYPVGGVSVELHGLGFVRPSVSYAGLGLERSANDLIWDSNEPEMNFTVYPFGNTGITGDPPEEPTANPRRIIHWDVLARADENWASRTNPDNGPCAYCWTIDVDCRGLNLTHYGYKLIEQATEDHAGIALSIWTNDSGVPGTEITGTRALLLPQAFESGTAGWHWLPLDTENNGGYEAWQLVPGIYWVVAVVDRQDTGPVPIVPAPYVWWDALTTTVRSKRISFADLGLPEIPALSWLEAWNDVNALDVQYVPAIYAAGD